MVLGPPPLALEAADGWMNEFGWAVLALVGVFTVSLYLWSYLNKNIEVWKTHDGKYFDAEVLDYARRMLQAFIVLALLVAAFLAVSFIMN